MIFIMIDSEKLLNDIISKLNLIDETDIPTIDLYMDQVTTFMDTHLKSNKRFDDDKILTKTMINNYAKNDLLPPPVKKRYSKQHVILLIFIYYFKNILSINDIKTILAPISENYFDVSSEISLEDIYSSVKNLENRLSDDIKNDIQDKIILSKDSFSDVPDKDKDFLQLFSLIVSLSFDVYVKKQMIESIIDMLNANNETDSAKSRKDKENNKDKVKDKVKDNAKDKVMVNAKDREKDKNKENK